MKILVVDDHPDSVGSLSRLLEANGHATARAYDAPTLALMRAVKHAFDPDGILNPGKLLPDGP